MKQKLNFMSIMLFLLAASAFSDASSQTTVYFDLKQTTRPCDTQQSVAPAVNNFDTGLPHAVAFPNPFSEIVQMKADGNMTSVAVHDISGKVIDHIDPQGSSQLNFTTGNLPNGIYFFIISFENGSKTSLKLCKTF